VNYLGIDEIQNGGVANQITVNSGGSLNINSGGSANHTIGHLEKPVPMR
jgi:autotransporter passenger strand-loop-strand repeat protein